MRRMRQCRDVPRSEAKVIRLIALLAVSAGLAFPEVTLAPLRALVFEPNQGQTSSSVKYMARAPRATLWLTSDGAALSTVAGPDPKSGRVVLKLRFEGANRSPRIEGEDLRPSVSNYFLGRDPRRWRTGVKQFGKVRYRNVYPGIDIVFYGNPRSLEYDWIVQPGADPANIRFTFDGADGIAADADGDLVVNIGGVEIRNRKPRIYQRGAHGDRFVNGRYLVLGKRRAGFLIDRYDRAKELVVDPVLSYATFLGGSGGDSAVGIARDAQGNLILAGTTNSSNFPTKAGLFPGLSNATDVAFVAKINPAESGKDSLVWSTFLGGSNNDQASAVALDASGNVYVTGETFSSNFPLKNAFQTSFSTAANCTDSSGNANTCAHAFVSKISADGKTLVYSSYLGGTKQDEAFGIAVDASGNAYVTGQTFSTDFTTSGSVYQNSQKGSGDAFLSKISPSGGSLVYSTYFGGTGTDTGNAIAVTSSGIVYVAGGTSSPDLPVTSNAYQAKRSGITDSNAFLAKFDLSQSGTQQLTYSTYLGGANGGTFASAVTFDSADMIYLTGATNSQSFPVSSGAYEKNFGGQLTNANGSEGLGDAFVTKLNPSAQGSAQLVYSTYLGGALNDQGVGIAVDSGGRITVAGQTNSVAFPTTGGAFQKVNDGSSPSDKGFIARLDPSKSGSHSLLYSTYVGGSLSDDLSGLAMNPTGNIVAVAGTVLSHNAPVTLSAFQGTFGGVGGGTGDAYVAQFDLSATGPVCDSIVDSASFTDRGLSPGLIFTIRGSGLGPTVGQTEQLEGGHVTTALAGVQVLVDGVLAPLLYVQENQINAVAPYELANSLGDVVNAQVIYNGVGSNLIADTVVIAAPAIFSLGNGQGAILNQDNSVNGPQNPALKGSFIQIFATGEGPIYPAGTDGEIAHGPVANLPHPILPVSVKIGGVTAYHSYAGTAPGSIEGLFQVNAKIPANVASGNIPVTLIVGGATSLPLNVAVK
jgi:uncharacterized protein (TIGR03437 family)